jgi:DNA cross-link repair 1A protein
MAKMPMLGRQVTTKTPPTKKTGNKSILSFFGKAETREEAAAIANAAAPLFFKDFQQNKKDSPAIAQNSRFNEDATAIKRRRLSENEEFGHFSRTPSPGLGDNHMEKRVEEVANLSELETTHPPKKYKAGFLDDSSDEEDNDWTAVINKAAADPSGDIEPVRNTGELKSLDDIDTDAGPRSGAHIALPSKSSHTTRGMEDIDQDRSGHSEVLEGDVPALNREATSVFEPGDFGDEDFENDEFFEGGEEYMERRWMEEQREMGLGLDDEDSKSETESVRTPQSYGVDDVAVETGESSCGLTVCPICDGNMTGLTESQASNHVNACLDGNAEPLPKQPESRLKLVKQSTTDQPETSPSPSPANPTARFKRAAIARPAQSNPFDQTKGPKTSSAFARLMSGHAEDAAWAEAASNEAQSRGKPAYQRTCPFYKIMPGLFICVDAFRYGKVEGQNAYFLSHFHSDHYIGLTSSWCHGPIYASKVTCNLMIQQLRVDPKWVIPLEFEKKVEVPNTKGVYVTMIPANHCPGSSLYLFEKVTGKNKDGSPRQTRILHCGDFRACPAHVAHPLLRPDIVDSITGQTKQQTIDTCYLDTTYLTPKYAFPSQHDVIDACAQMCVSLSKETVDSSDNWEKVKAERAGSVMKKFLEQGENDSAKTDAEEDKEEVNKTPKTRGRLLVVIGTYSIGKERICLGIAKALESKIYAPPSKMRICKCLEDPELNARLTSNPIEAQVHMTPLMEIRADTLHDYMMGYNGHFARVVGFRPTGWSYRPPTSRFTENPAVNTVLHSDGWKTRYTMRDLAPQRGSTRESNCFGVPYSEHSSFRELTMFCCALRINRIVPTVNVGSARSREKMKGWIEKWDAEKRKNGLFKVETGAEGWGSGDGKLRYGV